MGNNFQQKLNRLHMILDAILIAAAYALAWFITYGGKSTSLQTSFYFRSLLIIIPGLLLINVFSGVYPARRGVGRKKELLHLIRANVAGILIFTLVLYLGAKNPYLYNFSRRMLIYFFIFTIILELASRYAVRYLLKDIKEKGITARRVLLVGYSRAAEGFIDRIQKNPEWGYEVTGILDNQHPAGYQYKNISVIGSIQELTEILKRNELEEIAITLGLADYDYLEEIVQKCEYSGVHTKFIPDYNDIIPTVPQVEDVQGLPVINIRRLPLNDWQNAAVKRIMDIFGSAFGLILFSPVMLITMIIIKLTDRGPIFYAQERVGKHNEIFKMYKFRSMTVQNEEDEKKEWTTKNDPRVTPIGKLIRRTSIDEMPQFWNILKGDMSLVGPRPERPQFVEKFRDEIPHYMIKHQVRPGLTGWAQVNGFRGDTSIEERIKCDLYYIENWTFWLDIKILFMTIFKGFVNKNAY